MNNKQIEPGAHVLDTKRGRVGVVIELAEAPEYPGEHGWTHYRIKFNTWFRRTRWAYASDLRVVKIIVLLIAALLALSTQASAQQASYHHDGPAILPDDGVTPGVVRTSDASEICNPKFRTKPWRKTTQAMKNHVYAAYGVARNKGMCRGGCEVDHRLPLELGGLDDERNLWPQPSQPLPGFHQKDKLENALKKAVCKDHSMSLAEAQKMLLGDWYSAYEVVVLVTVAR